MSAPAFFIMWVIHRTVSSCSSMVPAYACSTTDRILAISSSYGRQLPGCSSGSAGADDQGIRGFLRPLVEVAGPAALRTVDPVSGASLVDAQPAVDPLELDVAGGLFEERADEARGRRVLLVLDRRALHRGRMGLLRLHGQRHRALVGEDVDADS